MTIFIDGHLFGYEMQRVAQMFFPGQKVQTAQGSPAPDFVGDCIVTALSPEGRVYVGIRIGGVQSDAADFLQQEEDKNAQEHRMGVLLYQLASKMTGLRPPWGVLTGIRPVKLFLGKIQEGYSEAQLRQHFIEGRLMSPERFALALDTARVEQPILDRSTPDSYSLYVSIPFCPTRCAYCSFVSHSIDKAAKLIPDYVDKLCEELETTAQIASSLGLRLRTIYFGGGTPTTLSAEQLKQVTETIERNFDLSGLWEYTVEAGRPDTVTCEKLETLKQAGVGRISINPQTLSNQVLERIGRRHTAEQFFSAVELAREVGFPSINMDLIAGLPTDTYEGFCRSVDGVLALSPENVTVHTLTVKRSARVTFEEARDELELVGKMVDYAKLAVTRAGQRPYYLYRQTGSLSSLENVGYAKPGCEGLYNIYMMDETHTVLAVGAGGSTRLKHPVTGEIERIYNYKYPYEYLERYDIMNERKKRILEFYRENTL